MASAVTSTRPTIFPSLHADFLLNTSTTSQPHCSHVQPQRRGDGPPEPSESGPAAFRMHLLQAAVSIFFFSFPRHILARSVAKLTVLHQSRESPTRKSHAFFFFFFFLTHGSSYGSVRRFLRLLASHFKTIAFGELWQQHPPATCVDQLPVSVYA